MSTATKTFRASNLTEALAQVRAELGPDAVVIRRREGLHGGVAGFFQKAVVEIEAH
jgi:flagellar biosynthesis GTPase FlhF